MPSENSLDYVEIPVKNIAASKAFFQALFGWEFIDYGETYTCFNDGRLTGGLALANADFGGTQAAPLLVFYSAELSKAEDRVLQAGGKITQPTFDFPGGRRFHFQDISGIEHAIWSDK